jgi:phosphoribosylformylglycinamidine cyclo-ligase
VFENAYGKEWHLRSFQESTLGHTVLSPSIIYTPLIIDLTGGYNSTPHTAIKGMAHITGGGIPGKLGRLLHASGRGALLDDLFEPPELILHCQSVGNVEDREAYKTWNMGQGLLVVTESPEIVISRGKELGFTGRTVGKVTKSAGIHIHSRGLVRDSVLSDP